ncbi:MAG TPA: alkaline phosphatase family protein [Limnobacter sp.]|uniref:alkaline phosphatase family protein n=1 Tax=Limnobacter sp. TaxID=2003368 RepID=UPI002ED78CD9
MLLSKFSRFAFNTLHRSLGLLGMATALTATLGLAACNSDTTSVPNAVRTAPAGVSAGASACAAKTVDPNNPMSAVCNVFVIVLENKDFAATFGDASVAPYLSKTLTSLGAFVPNYYGVAHNSNPNYLAMISGQGPNPQTQADCQLYSDFVGNSNLVDPNGQAIGTGCVYPAFVKTVADQLDEKKLSWMGYMEDMGKDKNREAATCAHPAINAQDNTQSATAADQYAARHNPFVYFHSIIDDQARCDQHVVNLDRLAADLQSPDTTANFNLIVPNLCNDGHDTGCKNGDPGGLVSADAFLKRVVPTILNSPAFKAGGLLIVTFDEADLTGSPSPAGFNPLTGKAAACCSTVPNVSLNSPLPGIVGFGGGQVGAVMVSPFIRPGTVSQTAYNHYSLLRSVEDGFQLAHLGWAGQAGLSTFGKDVLNQVH